MQIVDGGTIWSILLDFEEKATRANHRSPWGARDDGYRDEYCPNHRKTDDARHGILTRNRVEGNANTYRYKKSDRDR